MVGHEQVDCFKCRHFYVTWDKDYPRGCRALGFKGKKMPSEVVYQASGTFCLHFADKTAEKTSKK